VSSGTPVEPTPAATALDGSSHQAEDNLQAVDGTPGYRQDITDSARAPNYAPGADLPIHMHHELYHQVAQTLSDAPPIIEA
jgi:hypothetical protein